MKNKKGVEMSLSTIVIAAICLFVLVILIVLVSKQGVNVSKSTTCITKGGSCQKTNCGSEKLIGIGDGYCPDTTAQYCCRPI
ncbi:MAG: hypothetical protein ABIC91_01395 [Nanoarchaeota archaeon]|nr:hypothetical protein [Nanoarchaeota archaeon]MBU1029864.1 hypothetical protein [Nanoarchaeota archaeon]MBU1849286.1 hypothetical protein [Nanoarchaeota archaeon]